MSVHDDDSYVNAMNYTPLPSGPPIHPFDFGQTVHSMNP